MTAQEATISYKDAVFQKIKQNYQSVILGALVVIVGLSVFFRLTAQEKSKKISTSSETEATAQKEEAGAGKKYTVKKGDNLWKIAESEYGSGYNALDIATANKLANANIIEVGQVLVIPAVAAKKATKGEIAQAKTEKVSITTDTYTVKTGDTLWKVAVEAYGDGYQWAKIAKENKLSDPDVIHGGNTLKLPR